MVEKIIAYSVLLCSAFFVGKILEGVLFIVPFLVLRQMTGGFHAKTIWRCLCGSTITMLLALQIICPLVEKHEIVYGILFFYQLFVSYVLLRLIIRILCSQRRSRNN